MIPKGFVNATEMCKANGKKLNKYFENSKTQPFLDALSKINVKKQTPCKGDTVIILTEGANENRGTWVSFEVAVNLAQWISPEFAAWASIVLASVLKGDSLALTEELAEAQEKLLEGWIEVRKAGKVTRRTLTDAIKDWYIRNPDGSSRPQHVMYAVTTNKIYQVLWNKTALEIEALLGCERNKSRDFMSVECLQVLDRAEHRVMEFIDNDNIKPVDAVELSGLRKSRVPLV
jgi:hypothetical protein